MCYINLLTFANGCRAPGREVLRDTLFTLPPSTAFLAVLFINNRAAATQTKLTY